MTVIKRKILSITTLLTIVTTTHAQHEKVVFPTKTITIKEAFCEIEKQTDYLISYSSKDMDLNKRVTLTTQDISLQKVLQEILKDSGYKGDIRGNHILIVSAPTYISAPKTTDMVHTPEQTDNTTNPDNRLLDLNKLKAGVIAIKNKRGEIQLPTISPVLNIEIYEGERTASPRYTKELPKIGIRTNLLYGFGTFTPNIGSEAGLTARTSLLFTGSYNGWRKNTDNKKLWHWTAGSEYRYWLWERFNGHFFGVHALYGQYNIAGKKIPMLFEKGSENYRYQGHGTAAGISYGYQFIPGKHWNIELNAGIGIGFLKYDKWECTKCGEKLEDNVKQTFVAPSKIGISMIYTL
ncbi:MAG: DUF3575 domain-containing protein [Tannerellaceae bacterium]|nr:DUF3575 domain-containing protein [Tannerellaceae bacterium]